MGVIENEATRNAIPTAPKRMTRCRSRTMGRVFVKYSYAVSTNGNDAMTCINMFRHAGVRVIMCWVGGIGPFRMLRDNPTYVLLEGLPKVLCKVAPDAMDMGTAITRVVMFK